METYTLALDDLLRVLQSAGQAYHLRASLPASFPSVSARRGERLVVDVTVSAGQISSCRIWNQQGIVRLQGDQALTCVRSHEELIWIVTLVSPSPSGTSPPLSVGTTFSTNGAGASGVTLPWVARPPPIRLRADPGMFAFLSPRQRRVWLLIDGRRTVYQLASLLQMSLETLDLALTALERQGLISSGPLQQRR